MSTGDSRVDSGRAIKLALISVDVPVSVFDLVVSGYNVFKGRDFADEIYLDTRGMIEDEILILAELLRVDAQDITEVVVLIYHYDHDDWDRIGELNDGLDGIEGLESEVPVAKPVNDIVEDVQRVLLANASATMATDREGYFMFTGAKSYVNSVLAVLVPLHKEGKLALRDMSAESTVDLIAQFHKLDEWEYCPSDVVLPSQSQIDTINSRLSSDIKWKETD